MVTILRAICRKRAAVVNVAVFMRAFVAIYQVAIVAAVLLISEIP